MPGWWIYTAVAREAIRELVNHPSLFPNGTGPSAQTLDLTWLFWTKRCERIAWKGAGHAEEEVQC